jgi:hypothetical protein
MSAILEGQVALRREVDRRVGCDVLSATLPIDRSIEQPSLKSGDDHSNAWVRDT